LRIENKKFAETNIEFRKSCELAGITPTARQGSKFRNGKGTAYRFKKNAIKEINRKDENKI
jgi:hypothetical protein